MKPPVEKKTWAALLGGTLAGAGLYVIDTLTSAAADPAVFSRLPGPLLFLVTALAPGALAVEGMIQGSLVRPEP